MPKPTKRIIMVEKKITCTDESCTGCKELVSHGPAAAPEEYFQHFCVYLNRLVRYSKKTKAVLRHKLCIEGERTAKDWRGES